MPEQVKAYLEGFKSDFAEMKRKLPKAVMGFGTLFQNVMAEGALPTKQKELVAVGIAVAQRCVPCINLHVQKSLVAGCTPDEILEAASVAVMMAGGPAYTHLPMVMKALEALKE